MVASRLDVPRPATSRNPQKLIDEVGAQGLRAALHLRVPVEVLTIGSGVALLALQIVEQLDQVPLQRVGAALAVLVVVLTEVLVEERGVRDGEVAVDSPGGQPLVQVPARDQLGLDRLLFVRPAIAVVDRPQVIRELGHRLFPVTQHAADDGRIRNRRGGTGHQAARDGKGALQRASGRADGGTTSGGGVVVMARLPSGAGGARPLF